MWRSFNEQTLSTCIRFKSEIFFITTCFKTREVHLNAPSETLHVLEVLTRRTYYSFFDNVVLITFFINSKGITENPCMIVLWVSPFIIVYSVVQKRTGSELVNVIDLHTLNVIFTLPKFGGGVGRGTLSTLL